MGGFDVILVKYGATMVAYTILGLPVFGPGNKEYLEQIKNDVPMMTSDYMRNSSLLINLSKAIGRLVISYKEIQQLAGYTALVYDVRTVLKDLDKGSYVRTKVRDDGLDKLENQLLELKKGNVEIVPDYIQFIDMPI
jgi:ATP-binding cassette subfamily D (ALD) protein 3